MLAALATYASSAPSRCLELHARTLGHRYVAGVDEAGVGTIAGPLIAAAVILPPDAAWMPPSDSKSLPRRERDAAAAHLRGTPGLVWACAAVGVNDVDRLGASGATRAAMQVAASRLERRASASAVHYLVDGDALPAGLDGRAIVRGDQSGTPDLIHTTSATSPPPSLSLSLSLSLASTHRPPCGRLCAEACIAAASILASVAHEAAMRALARGRAPHWELDRNLGCPSREHLAHILAHGPS